MWTTRNPTASEMVLTGHLLSTPASPSIFTLLSLIRCLPLSPSWKSKEQTQCQSLTTWGSPHSSLQWSLFSQALILIFIQHLTCYLGTALLLSISFSRVCIFPLKLFCALLVTHLGFPGGSDDKESACNAGDAGSIPGLGRSPGEGNGDPLHCFCLKNPMDGGAWWATVHGVTKSWTRPSD